MKKVSRLNKSRRIWKTKAVDRATEIREMRKKIIRQEKRIKTQEAILNEKILRLKEENTYLQTSNPKSF